MPKKKAWQFADLSLKEKVVLILLLLLACGMPIFIVGLAATTRLNSQAANREILFEEVNRQQVFQDARQEWQENRLQAIPSPFPTSSQRQAPKVANGCRVTGCNNEICVNADSPEVVSTCQFNPAYVCYQAATCEPQVSGECGWTETESLLTCLGEDTSQLDSTDLEELVDPQL